MCYKPKLLNLELAGVWLPCCATSSLGARNAIHAASHVDYEKKCCMVFYFFACKWFCSYSYGALWAPLDRLSSAVIANRRVSGIGVMAIQGCLCLAIVDRE